VKKDDILIYDILFIFQFQVSSTVMDLLFSLCLYLYLRCCVSCATVFLVNKDFVGIFLRVYVINTVQIFSANIQMNEFISARVPICDANEMGLKN